MSISFSETGADVELVALLAPEQARDLTRKIRIGLEGTYTLIVEAFRGGAWSALGYPSWDAYCQGEFGNLSLQPPREERQQVILSLREAGMSVRAIASATALGTATVSRELTSAAAAGVPNGTPEPEVRGLDGKTYPARPAAKPEPDFMDEPLSDELLDMSADALGIGVKAERPAPRTVEKPKTVGLPTGAPVVTSSQRGSASTDPEPALFPIERVRQASRSLVTASDLLAEANLNVEALSEDTRAAVRGDLQDALDRLNRVLALLA